MYMKLAFSLDCKEQNCMKYGGLPGVDLGDYL